MEYKEIINRIKPELEKTIDFLGREMTKIRTGRASVSLVEDITVNYLGQKFPLKQLATILVPEARKITIQPWDKSYLESIEKAISQSSVGAAPIVDKEMIRITLPPMNEEYRKNFLKFISEKQEETRKTVRRWREQAWDEVQEGFKNKEIREDDKFRAKDELQELVDKYNEKIEEIGERKKKEITE